MFQKEQLVNSKILESQKTIQISSMSFQLLFSDHDDLTVVVPHTQVISLSILQHPN